MNRFCLVLGVWIIYCILWQRNQILQPNIIPLVSAQVTKMSHQNGLSLPDPILVGG